MIKSPLFAILLTIMIVIWGSDILGKCLFENTNQNLVVQLEPSTPLEEKASERLRKGLTIVVQNSATKPDSKDPWFSFGCQAYFDPWEETYSVKSSDNVGKTVIVKYKSLSKLPKECLQYAFKQPDSSNKSFHITTQLDPVTDAQVKKTSEWLATRGIGPQAGILGRAVGAVLDLKSEIRDESNCEQKLK